MNPQRLFAALLLTVFPLAAATLTHDYQFQNTLADSLGGPYSLVIHWAGPSGAGEYTFGADQGLSLSNALLNDADYSIYIDLEFDSLSGYKKIVDFKDHVRRWPVQPQYRPQLLQFRSGFDGRAGAGYV